MRSMCVCAYKHYNMFTAVYVVRAAVAGIEVRIWIGNYGSVAEVSLLVDLLPRFYVRAIKYVDNVLL